MKLSFIRSIKSFLILFLLAIIFIGGCKPREKKPFGRDPKIENKKWALSKLNGNTISTDADGKKVIIQFETETNEFDVEGLCNNLHGMYTTEGDLIKIQNMFSTKMACPKLSLENEFVKMIDLANHYKLKSIKINGKQKESLELFQETTLIAIFEIEE